jgi:hypothetical protein
MATDHSIEIAKLALPHLVDAAQKRETLTYGGLGQRIRRHHRTLSYPLGYIRDEICRRRDLPWISAIVVNGNTGLPGDDFLPEGTANLTPAEYREKFEGLRDSVFRYSNWGVLLKELRLTPIRKNPADLDSEARAYLNVLKRSGGGPEGAAHLQLKEFVVKHPETVGLTSECVGKKEFCFLSGDECDVVFFVGRKKAVVVEIKNGERGELVKGIYQTVKYRALMTAEMGHGSKYPVDAFLVAYDIPSDIVGFAKRFRVRCTVVARSSLGQG